MGQISSSDNVVSYRLSPFSYLNMFAEVCDDVVDHHRSSTRWLTPIVNDIHDIDITSFSSMASKNYCASLAPRGRSIIERFFTCLFCLISCNRQSCFQKFGISPILVTVSGGSSSFLMCRHWYRVAPTAQIFAASCCKLAVVFRLPFVRAHVFSPRWFLHHLKVILGPGVAGVCRPLQSAIRMSSFIAKRTVLLADQVGKTMTRHAQIRRSCTCRRNAKRKRKVGQGREEWEPRVRASSPKSGSRH